MACCSVRAPQEEPSPRPIQDDGGRGLTLALVCVKTAASLDDPQQLWLNAFAVSSDRSMAESTLQACHIRLNA